MLDVWLQFALLETALTCLQDEIPKLRKYKWLLCIASGAVCYLLALPCTTPVSSVGLLPRPGNCCTIPSQ